MVTEDTEILKLGWCPECGDTKYDIKKGRFVFCSHCGVCKGIDCNKPLTYKEREMLKTYRTCESGWNIKFYLEDLDD